MPLFTICFMVTGGIQIEAESEDEALDRFASGEFDAEIGEILGTNEIDVTDVCEEEE